MSMLYELEGIYAQLLDMDLDDETFQDTLDSLDFQADLENNIEYFVKMLKNKQADAEAYKQAKQEFADKEKQAKKAVDRYKEIIDNAMTMSQSKKVDTGLFVVSKRKSKAVNVVDEKAIPLEYMTSKTEWKPNKTEIAKHLKAGESIEGVELVERESVVIK